MSHGIAEHRSLTQLVGVHFPLLADAIKAAALLGLVEDDKVAELKEVNAHCSWAKHAPFLWEQPGQGSSQDGSS